MTLCFDSAAAVTALKFGRGQARQFNPDRSKRVELTTASGSKSADYEVYDIIVHGKGKDIKFNCLNISSLPYPRVRRDSYEAIRASGFDFLPSQAQIDSRMYILLGAPHMAYFPRSMKQKLVPQDLRRKMPTINLYRSVQ